jgi:Family of unknown function (DUF6516)
MKAVLVLRESYPLSEVEAADLVMWQLPSPMPGSVHFYKYRLAFVCRGKCVLRFDNERGKGDHMHVGGREYPFAFSTADQLIDDFWNEVHKWRVKHRMS